MNPIKVIIWLLQQKRHLILRTLNSMSFISSDEKRPALSNTGRREKINFNFYFHTSCGDSKCFMKTLKAFIKPLEGSQANVKINV